LWLYERGKIDLNDVVRKYYPEFPYTDVLIKDLLSHRSGIPNYMYVFGDSARRLQPARPTNQDIMRWFAHGQPRAYTQPDVRFAYNNSNYAVLAAIIEKISGLNFDEFLRKNIFLPLNMHDTFVITTTNDSINRNRTFGYTNTQQPIPTDTWDGVTGDKGVYSTTNDLYKWYKALHSSCLLKPETLKMAFEPRSFEQNGTRNYGYGFRLKTNPSGNNYIYHNGWWKGYNATFGFSPTDDYVIIVLSNRLNRTVYDVQPIINILTGQTQPTTNYNAANPSARNNPSSISSEENEGAGFE
jgi:CubicO group peptidase (beta-lactamase class C family)